jgi:NAD(P)H-hydrate epimerase
MQNLKGFSKGLFASKEDVRKATADLDIQWNKYTRGSVLIIGGSFEWKGAAEMAFYAANNALAALRTVSGYVTFAASKKMLEAASIRSSVFVLNELNGNADHDIKTIGSIRHDSLVMGPGIPKEGVSRGLLRKIISLEKKKKNMIVIDAAMIGVMANNKSLINEGMILTPHAGEFRKLTGKNLKNKSIKEKINAVKEFTSKYNCTLVLKGHETIISDGKRLKINISKTPALATMGTGDVLCGIIASYAASHKDPFESAVAGVYVHSAIGDLLFKSKGEHIIATDIIDAIPKVIKEFDKR